MEKKKIAIELHNIKKEYGSGKALITALAETSLHIETGEIVLIMGPSGAGKTTLLQIIGALMKPSSGQILINDKILNRMKQKQLSDLRLSTFGFIYQAPNLISALTALENIQFALKLSGVPYKKNKKTALKILDLLGLNERVNHKPSKLSGGEQQRVSIARALVNNPSIILADEPTANLDSKSGYQVMELLRKIAKIQGKTVVIVTHDSRIRNLADRILWLEDGKLSVQNPLNGWVIDPVCLMVLNPQNSKIKTYYENREFYFCSEKCKIQFLGFPEKYEYGSKKKENEKQ
ncbi:ATP-binding cassette domain-containing protein [Candidatus Lokiarchaeum ossiferum]|uniref:ATP-binding cassette domain-containing protein n=1 Tax=Candidatus Lokiarchaeum ossiferum TaxID=2951803 RepID=UPI00352CC7A0